MQRHFNDIYYILVGYLVIDTEYPWYVGAVVYKKYISFSIYPHTGPNSQVGHN